MVICCKKLKGGLRGDQVAEMTGSGMEPEPLHQASKRVYVATTFSNEWEVLENMYWLNSWIN